MLLAPAQKLATRIATELAPLCDRIEIAGSIRRCRPQVNDIDLVLLTRDPAAVKARCLHHATAVTDGPQNAIYRLHKGIQLDLFFARPTERDLLETRPGNFASIYLCRTGSREHNIWFLGWAESKGLQWHTYTGLMRGNTILNSETEEDLYRSVGLPYIEPQHRELPHLVQTYGKPQ